MSLAMGLALYFIIWWTVLFAVLPLGVRTQGDAGEIVQGTPESAPVSPRMARVAGITTVVASFVFAAVWLTIRFKLIPLDLLGPAG
jgi:predicted secreted protein